MNTSKIKIALIALFCCWAAIAEAQMANVTYSTRSGFVRSSDVDCQDGDTEEYTAWLWTKDNVNATEGTTNCMTVDFNGTTTWAVNSPAIVSARTNASWQIIARIDAWEEDSDNRCVFQGGPPADACRQTASQTFDFRALATPSNGTWTNGPTAGSANNHQYAIGVTWKYAAGGSTLTPALSCDGSGQTVSYSTGVVPSWSVALTAGTTYVFENCGLATNDTYLRIYGTDGFTVVSSNDDGCSAQSTITYTPSASGTYFVEVAQYSRGALAAAGSLRYYIKDVTTPTVATCPANISLNTAAGTCGAVATYSTPTFSDNCTVTVVRTAGGASGTTFPLGTTTVTHTGTDPGGRSATCNFNVTVTDNQAPAITCPANIGVNVAAGTCAQTVTYTAPTGTDNCSGATTTLIGGLGSGSSYPKGVTTNTFRVTDAAGNTATCSFTVTVTDNQAPAITCPANIGVNVAAGTCAQTVTYTAPTGTDNCSGASTTLIGGLGSGSSFPTGVTTNTFRVTDAAGLSSTCSFTVTVTDNQAPAITCPANIGVNVAAGTCAQTVTFTAPTGTDNCSGAATTQIAGSASGSSFPKGVTTNTFRVTDAAGLTATCSFTVTVTDNQAPVITCPANIGVNVAAGTCAQTVTYTAPTGTDNCPGATTTQIAGLASAASYPKGVTTNTFRVTDAVGLSSTCSFTVTVTDNEAPSITCPANIAVNVAAGTCAQTATYTAPTGTDNCPGATTTQIAGLASAASYPKGVTTNTFRVTDAVGQSNTCSFTVTVTDNEAPSITCPANIAVNVAAGTCAQTATYTAPTGTDNCPGATTAQIAGLASGASYPKGTTTNTFRVTDAAGLSSTCSFTVTVTDNEAPSITCPANIAVNVAAGTCAQTATYTAPTGTDNCPGATTVQIAGLASGASYPKGTTTNTFRVTDAVGQTSTCSFTVTVTDNEAPVVTCPANISVNNDLGVCGASVTYSISSSDNCPGQTVAQTGGQASASIFPIGTTTNSFTVTDAVGLTSTCSFTVSVADAENPTITCPAPITVNAASGICSAVVTYTAPVGADNCSGQTTAQTAGLVSGASYAVGTTTNTFTVTDASGNKASCSFAVTVIDNQAPVITTCPLDKFTATSPGTCLGNVSIGALSATDNCSVQSISNSFNNTSNASGLYTKGLTVVTWTVTDVNGNTSTCETSVYVYDAELPVAACKNVTLQLNGSSFVSITPSTIDNGSTDNCTLLTGNSAVSQTTFTCSNIGANTVTLTVIDNSGNTGTCNATVTIVDNVAPTAICQNITVPLDANGNVTITPSQVNNGSNDACGIQNSSLNISSFSCANLGSGNTVVLTVSDYSGNASTCSATVTVIDNIKPTAVCNNFTVALNNSGNATVSGADFSGASTDNCGITSRVVNPSSFTCANLGTNPVTVILSDQSGNTDFCTPTVTVVDNTAPSITCPANIAVNTDAGQCGALVTFAASATDNCTLSSLVQTGGAASGTQFPVGLSTISYKATDQSGNTSTCSFTIAVTDIEKPTAVCQNVTVSLNNAGNGTTSAAAVNNGSSDACGVQSLALSNSAFTCANVGANTVILTVTDNNGNTKTCSATVTVQDNVAPVALCKNVSVTLVGASGSTTAAAVNNGSSDACGVQSLSLSQTTFTCANVGANAVVLTVTDVNGNSSTCGATVTVTDNTAPAAICKNITVQLNAAGTASITGADVNNNSTDACGIASLAAAPNTFNCSNVTPSAPTELFISEYVEGSSNIKYLEIYNGTASSVNLGNYTLRNYANGSTTVTSSNVLSGSLASGAVVVYKNSLATGYAGPATALAMMTFNGNDAVALYNNSTSQFCDIIGNIGDDPGSAWTASGLSTVDRTLRRKPSVNKGVTVDPTGTGASSFTTLATEWDGFATDDVSGLGSHAISLGTPVVLTVTDVNGNSSTCSATVKVEDKVAPTALCKNINLPLNASGNATIVVNDLDNGSSDACGISTRTISKASFNCGNVGANAVILTVTDINNNTSTCTSTVTVQDLVAPVALCKNATVSLDNAGSGSITVANINNGSSDACGIATTVLSNSSFTCANVGANSVTLTVTDVNGNSSTCSSTVTVQDLVAPTAICKNITVQLNAAGTATITGADVNNNSTDNCGVASTSVSPNAFNCNNLLGAVPTELFISEYVEGSSNIKYLEIYNGTTGSVNLGNYTLRTYANGSATVTSSNVLSGSLASGAVVVYKNSAATGYSGPATALGMMTFNGNDAVALYNNATSKFCDIIGNIGDDPGSAWSASGLSTVDRTLRRKSTITQGITVDPTGSGVGSFTSLASEWDGFATDDVSGLGSHSVIAGGNNPVTLTVTDVNGNTSICTAIVKVEDKVAPVATCQNVTVQLNSAGNGSTTAAAVNNGSSDACGVASLSLSTTSFGCANVGANSVVLTVTDVNGNSSTCGATVTVEDKVAPVAICQNVTVQLNSAGNGSTTPAAVNNGSTDACGVASLSLSTTSFNCTNVGANAVVLTVTDVNGNSSTCGATVTVQDNIAPTITCNTDVNVSNDAGLCSAVVNYSNSSTDNCSGQVITQTGGLPSGSAFPKGTTTNSFKVTDASGNTATCSFTVTVNDTENPTITCNANVNVSNDAGLCSAVVNYSNSSTDNCAGQVITQTAGLPSGSAFPKGTTTNSFTVTDASGNTATCSFTVTVNDTELPTITCPAPVSVNNDLGVCGASVNYSIGSTDNCTGQIVTQTGGLASGSTFPVGTTTNSYIVTDASGNTATCSFTVSVTDTENPIITCPADVVIYCQDPDGVAATGNATATDNCGSVTITSSDINYQDPDINSPGHYQYTIHRTFTATDLYGNSSSCTQTITHSGTGPVVQSVNYTGYLDNTGTLIVYPSDINNGSTDPCGPLSFLISHSPPGPFLTFTCADVGIPQNVRLVAINNVNDTFYVPAVVTVLDAIAPTITCNANVNVSNDAGLCSAVVNYSNSSTDNCAGQVITQTAGLPSGSAFPKGTTTNSFTVTDASGNTATCSFTVTVNDTENPTITCNANVNVSNDVGLCSAVVNYSNSSTDNCSGQVITQTAGLPSGSAFPKGTTTNSFLVTDASGNTATCSFTVTVNDTELPTITCNANVNVSNDAGLCSAVVNYSNSSTDNCAGQVITQTGGLPSGSAFPKGTTTNSFTVTDASGNTATCSFTVTVNDTEVPTITCPANIAVNTDNNVCGAAVSYSVGSTDNCAGQTVAQTGGLASGSTFPLGTTTNSFKVTDASGNTATCSFTVSVTDVQLPNAVCKPAMVTLAGGTASITTASVDNNSSDACGIASLSLSKSTFNCSNIGANIVTLTVTDNNGNSSTCNATVTVVGTIPSAVISQSTLPQFCQGNQVILTATPSEPVTYAWENGQTTQTINVYASGTYNLNVTNGNGCVASVSTYVNYNPVGFNAAYTIVSFEKADLHRNTVLNGGVGVLTAGEEAEIEKASVITAPTTFVKAPVLDIRSDVFVTNQYVGVANFTVPAYFGNPYAGVTNVNVADNSTVTLSDSIYKNIQIGKNATVTFTRPIIYIDELKVKEGARVKVSGCTKISVNKKVDFEKNTKFNLEQNKVTLYVGEEDKKDDKKVVEWSEGSVFYGNVFAQRGEIRTTNAPATNPIKLTGQFIGREVEGGENTIWDWSTTCDPNCTPAPAPACACVGGLKKITFEYSIWDSSSVSTNATMYVFSNATLTDTLAKFYNVNPGDIFTVSATSLPGGVFNGVTYVQIAQNPDSIIVIPTTCNADIVGSFYRELYMYSQVDNSNVLCGISSCANGKTLMCHKPKNKAGHTHCVKDKDVQKKLNSKGGEWSVGTCANNRDIEAAIPDEIKELQEVEMTAMPNPFFDITNIKLKLPADARVRLAVYNAVGQEVELLYSGTVEGGLEYIYQFNGAGHASGMYFYRLETSEGKHYVKPIILSK